MKNSYVLAMTGLIVGALGLSFPTENYAQTLSIENQAQKPPAKHRHKELISESALLAGLAPGALYPFIDSTPRRIVRAHIAITDATSTCVAEQGAPSNILILAGVAGGDLVNVATAATNTGIGTTTQCVFHVTIKPGEEGVPAKVTDIVVVNSNGSAALTGINTITVSAEVF